MTKLTSVERNVVSWVVLIDYTGAPLASAHVFVWSCLINWITCVCLVLFTFCSRGWVYDVNSRNGFRMRYPLHVKIPSENSPGVFANLYSWKTFEKQIAYRVPLVSKLEEVDQYLFPSRENTSHITICPLEVPSYPGEAHAISLSRLFIKVL